MEWWGMWRELEGAGAESMMVLEKGGGGRGSGCEHMLYTLEVNGANVIRS